LFFIFVVDVGIKGVSVYRENT